MNRVSAIATKAFTATAFLCLASVAALAHHSGAMFDSEHPIAIKGEVMEFRWTNPHVYVEVYGTTKTKPTPQVWSIEFTSPANLARAGWSRKSLQPGDKLTVLIAPMREGGPGGGFRKATLDATGKVLVPGRLADQTAPTE